MLKIFTILWNSFLLAMQELKVNKLRTFLSLLGITIGIFCIIGVLATVDSLEKKVQSDIQSLGTNTIYIDKWEYAGGTDYPWWKFVNRPLPKYSEVRLIKERSSLATEIAFFASATAPAHYDDYELDALKIYCVTEDFDKIQSFEVADGRYFSETDFQRGNPVAVIGNEVALQLFGGAEYAEGKSFVFNNQRVTVIGVINKQGGGFINAFDYDNAMLVTYKYFASVYDLSSGNNSPFIIVKGKENVSSEALSNELRGIMRQIRKISPAAEDNFALNEVSAISKQAGQVFATVNIGGWAIAVLSLIVGAFGVANIMFVTVRERTSQIGLKKAIGATKGTILSEFLIESAFLCVIGGAIGVLLVWLLALAASAAMPFPIVLAPRMVVFAFGLCVVLGVLSGIIPAYTAAKLDPVVAIRS